MRRRILVIDDDPGVRSTLAAMLEERGYHVSLAENGERGLAAFRRERPDLVITDIVMPVKEGLETIRELRSEQPEVPIIAISAGARMGRHDFLDIARQLGVWDVAAKPFDPDDFIARVERCLG
jgi:DNA-binding response OmpR family regulator